MKEWKKREIERMQQELKEKDEKGSGLAMIAGWCVGAFVGWQVGGVIGLAIGGIAVSIAAMKWFNDH